MFKSSLVAVLILLCPLAAGAQENTGTITGLISDPSETRFFELRGEAYNVVNHPVFGAAGQTSAQGPVVAATNSSFGYITFQDNRSRSLQLGARFVW